MYSMHTLVADLDQRPRKRLILHSHVVDFSVGFCTCLVHEDRRQARGEVEGAAAIQLRVGGG